MAVQAEDTPAFAEGDYVRFNAYAQAPEDGELLSPGEVIIITAVNEDGGFIVRPVDESGVELPDRDPDNVFPEEVVELSEDEQQAYKAAAAQANQPAQEEPAQAQAVQEEAPEEPAQEEASAPAKGKKSGSKKSGSKKSGSKKSGSKQAKGKPTGSQAEGQTDKEPAPAPVQAVATAPGEVEVQLIDTESVRNVLSSQDALDAAKYLVNKVEETYFTLGGVLHHINSEGIHKAAGYEGKRGFQDYVQQNLGINYRKAMYLIDIYVKFRQLGIDEQRLAEIGWSKAKELARVNAEALRESFDELVDKAKESTRDELIEHIKSEYQDVQERGGQGEKTKVSKLNFKLFADQHESVMDAIEAAQKQLGTSDLNEALVYIVTQWKMESGAVEVSKEDEIAWLEQKHGVKLREERADVDQDEQAIQSAPAE